MHISSCLPSWNHAILLVVWGPVCSRWIWYLPFSTKFIYSSYDVHLLRAGCSWTKVPKVPLVEKIHDQNANNSIYPCDNSLGTAVVPQGLQVPTCICLLDPGLRSYLPLHVCQLLYTGIQEIIRAKTQQTWD